MQAKGMLTSTAPSPLASSGVPLASQYGAARAAGANLTATGGGVALNNGGLGNLPAPKQGAVAAFPTTSLNRRPLGLSSVVVSDVAAPAVVSPLPAQHDRSMMQAVALAAPGALAAGPLLPLPRHQFAAGSASPGGAASFQFAITGTGTATAASAPPAVDSPSEDPVEVDPKPDPKY